MVDNVEENNIDIFKEDPKKSTLKIAIPIMVTSIVTTLYNIIDGMWITGLGINAITGIGLITPLFTLINGVASGLGNGIISTLNRFREEYGNDSASTVGSQAIVISIVISIVLSIFLLISLNSYLDIYGGSYLINKEAINYATPLFLGLICFTMSIIFSNILRSEGNTKRPMYAISFGLILNAFLDPVFIYTLNLGSAGASISTILTSLISALIMYYWIFHKKNISTLINVKKVFKSKWDWFITKEILKTAIPASLVLFTLSFSTAIDYIFINLVGGDLGISICSSGYRIYLLGIMPATALSFSLVILTSTYYGARNIKFLKRAHTYGTINAFIFSLLMFAIFFIFSDQIASIFMMTTNNPPLTEGISLYIRITAFCFPFLGLGLPSAYLYQGTGKAFMSLLWTITSELICVVPAMYFIVYYFNTGLIGIWTGFVVGRGIANNLNFLFARLYIHKLEKMV